MWRLSSRSCWIVRDISTLDMRKSCFIPSPLAGEGWDGGEKCGIGAPPAFTPTLALPRREGGDMLKSWQHHVCRLRRRWREERALHRLEVLQTLEGIGAAATLSLLPFSAHIRGHRFAHQPAGVLPIGGQMRIDPVRDLRLGGGPVRQRRRTLLQAWNEVLDKIEPLIERYQA